jgi:hypothetical protein
MGARCAGGFYRAATERRQSLAPRLNVWCPLVPAPVFGRVVPMSYSLCRFSRRKGEALRVVSARRDRRRGLWD